MRSVALLAVAAAAGASTNTQAQPTPEPPANYDEAKVPPYQVPSALVGLDGKVITTALDWETKRRREIRELFQREIYGRTPTTPPPAVRYEMRNVDSNALGGKAIRKQIRVRFTKTDSGPYMDLLIYQPKKPRGRVPAFLGLNFRGNASVHSDPGVFLTEHWVPNDKELGITDHKMSEKSRGADSDRWQVEKIVAAGYALVTAYYGDLEPDHPQGADAGVRSLFPRPAPGTARTDEWGAVGAWAWGLSQALDYLKTDKSIAFQQVAVMGHSRLGKAALWAGAQDHRFALVVSNESGCLGAALSKRIYGETVGRITRVFPYWFAGNVSRYAENETKLPVDQNLLIALQAPRPVYVASAVEDTWADPRGEFLSAQLASPVWALFHLKGLAVNEMPATDQPSRDGHVGYHMRSGNHSVTAYDWDQYLAFADHHFRPKK